MVRKVLAASAVVSFVLLSLGCSSGEGTPETIPDSMVDVLENDLLEDLVLDERLPEELWVEDWTEVSASDLDVTPEADSVVEPLSCPAEFLKGPWFMTPEPGHLVILAETLEDCPMEIHVISRAGSEVYYSTPTHPMITILGIPMLELEGTFHRTEVTFPTTEKEVQVAIDSPDHFRTRIRVPQLQEQLKMVLVGDNRTNPDKHQMVVDGIRTHHPAVVLNSGDMVAAGPEPLEWQLFFDIEGGLLSETVFVPVMGNHELLGEGFFETFFDAPNALEGKPRNYWLDLGLVGVVVIERYSTDWTEPVYLEWLEASLQSLQDKPWLFVSYHEPAYTFSSHGPWLNAREYIHPLMKKYGVDLVISGHNHCYEHYNVEGIQYLVTGGGGAPLYGVHPDNGGTKETEMFVNGATMHHFIVLDIDEHQLHANVVRADNLKTYEEFDLTR